jgi:hypothetical protein
MPKAGPRLSPEEVRTIRGVYKAISNRNRSIGDLVEPKLRGSKKDTARVKTIVKLFRTNKDVRDTARSDLLAFGIKPRRKRK